MQWDSGRADHLFPRKTKEFPQVFGEIDHYHQNIQKPWKRVLHLTGAAGFLRLPWSALFHLNKFCYKISNAVEKMHSGKNTPHR